MNEIPVSLKKEICECYRKPDKCNGKLSICLLTFETTRRCNLSCIHCMKGDAQSVDIDPEVFDRVFENFGIAYRIGFAGGEIMLNLDALRYALESLKKHNVRVDSVMFTTNGIIQDPEFLEIYDEYLAYVRKPKECKNLISNDIFHRHSSGKSQKEMDAILKFFRNGKRRNKVSFQDVYSMGTIYRVGRATEKYKRVPWNYKDCKSSKEVWERFHEVRKKISSPEESELRSLYARMHSISQDKPQMKSPIQHFASHICCLEVSATGYYLNCDIITYADEDKPDYYVAPVSIPLKEIIKRDESDTEYRSVGTFLKIMTEIQNVVLTIRSMTQTAYGIPKLFPNIPKLKNKLSYLCRLLDYASSIRTTAIGYLRRMEIPGMEKKIQDMEKSFSDIEEQSMLKQIEEQIEKL